MNLLFCSHNGNREGPSITLLELARLFTSNGHSSHILFGTDGMLTHECKRRGTSYSVLSTSSDDIRKIIVDHQPDVAIVSSVHSGPLVSVCRELSIPVVWIIHEATQNLSDEQVRTLPKYCSDSDAVVFLSHYTRRCYETFDTGHFHVIHSGIDVESIFQFQQHNSKHYLRTKYCIPQDAFVFTSIGTIHEPKGFKDFVEAGLQLQNTHPSRNIHCFVIGTIDSLESQRYTDNLLRDAWRMGLRSHIHVYDSTSNIYDFYRMSDVYVCASHLQSFLRTILEAMAFGLPIISSDGAGIREQIEDNTHGLLYKANSVDALSHSMNTLMDNAHVRSRLGSTSRDHVSKNFRSNHMYTQYDALLHRITSKQSHPHVTTHSISLVMHAATNQTAVDAAYAAIATFPDYKEFVISLSGHLSRETLETLRHLPRVIVASEPTSSFTQLIENCTGEWICNVTDSDLWTYASLDNVLPDTGLLLGQSLQIHYTSGTLKPHSTAQDVSKTHWLIRKVIAHHFHTTIEDLDLMIQKTGWNVQKESDVFGISRTFTA